MEYLIYDRAQVEQSTTLEVALQVYNKDKFISFKRELLKSEFDEEIQLSIWKDYHDLMYKAASKTWGKSDGERLEYYRRVGNLRMHSGEIKGFHLDKIFLPTTFTLDDSGRIVEVDLSHVPNEIQGFHPNEIYLPTTFTRDDSGKIVGMTLNFVDHEVTRRWFDHIYDISEGLIDVRVCASCSNLFLRTRRKDVKFCGNTCRNRVWRKGKKKL